MLKKTCLTNYICFCAHVKCKMLYKESNILQKMFLPIKIQADNLLLLNQQKQFCIHFFIIYAIYLWQATQYTILQIHFLWTFHFSAFITSLRMLYNQKKLFFLIAGTCWVLLYKTFVIFATINSCSFSATLFMNPNTEESSVFWRHLPPPSQSHCKEACPEVSSRCTSPCPPRLYRCSHPSLQTTDFLWQ